MGLGQSVSVDEELIRHVVSGFLIGYSQCSDGDECLKDALNHACINDIGRCELKWTHKSNVSQFYMKPTRKFDLEITRRPKSSSSSNDDMSLLILESLSQTVCRTLVTRRQVPIWFEVSSELITPAGCVSYTEFDETEVTAITFGTFDGPCSFTRIAAVGGDPQTSFSTEFEFNRGKIYFYVSYGCRRKYFYLEVSTKSLHQTLNIVKGDNKIDVYFQLRYPPLIYERVFDDKRETSGVSRHYTGRWSRRHYLPDVRGETIGQCDVIRVSLGPSVTARKLQVVLGNIQSRQFDARTVQWNFYFTHITERRCPDVFRIPADGLPFSIVYAIAVLESVGLRCQLLGTRPDFREVLARMVKEKQELVEYFLYSVAEAFRKESMYYLIDVSSFTTGKVGVLQKRHQNKSLIRNVIVTPTSVVFGKPNECESNRIFREHNVDMAMKIFFRDEESLGGNLTKNLHNIAIHCSLDGQRDNEILRATVEDRLQKGIVVGERTYRVLGGSNSLLSEHGYYLYAGDCRGIRDSIGDLDRITNRAKRVARLGQAFSKTRTGVTIQQEWIRDERDIVGGKDPRGKPYCFSDGIGKISAELAEMVLGENRRKFPCLPSAYQIRMGGVKGVVAYDPTLKGKQIVIRPSMRKFASDHNDLEIVDSGIVDPRRPRRLNLNNQIVTILSQRGVPDRAFFGLFNEEIRRLLFALIEPSTARRILHENHPHLTKWAKYCRDLTLQPLVVDMIQEIMNEKFERLRRGDRRQISIPEHEGCNLMGVLDETRTLDYGQVYVGRSYGQPPRTGPVIVSKMPALHPGDVRKFQAVDVESLHHMYNVIVFPQRGERPHPNEMAGSDLDGDLYFVTWREDLIFKGGNVEPMDFPNSESRDHFSGPIEENDIIEEILFQIENDLKGRVSRQHLMFADFKGIFSEECITLAQLSAKIYDAPKTGVVPEWPKALRIRSAPDFLQKDELKQTYYSQKILGKLHRHIKDIEKSTDVYSEKITVIEGQIGLPLLPHGKSLPLNARNVEMAQLLLDSYNDTIESVMKEHGIGRETLALRARIPNYDHSESMQMEQRRLIDCVRNLGTHMRRQFNSAVKYIMKEKMSKPIPLAIEKELLAEISEETQRRDGNCFRGLELIFCFEKSEQSIHDDVVDDEAYARIGKIVEQELKKAEGARRELRLQKHLLARRTAGKYNETMKKQLVLLGGKPWLLLACAFVMEKVCTEEPGDHDAVGDALRHAIQRSLALKFHEPKDMNENERESKNLRKIVDTLRFDRGFMPRYFQTKNRCKIFNIIFESAFGANELANIGRVVIGSLWDIYAQRQGSVTDTGKQEALLCLLDFGLKRGFDAAGDQSSFRKQVTKSFTVVNIDLKRSWQQNKNEIEDEFRRAGNRFKLEFVNIEPVAANRTDLLITCRGYSHIVDAFQKCCRENIDQIHSP